MDSPKCLANWPDCSPSGAHKGLCGDKAPVNFPPTSILSVTDQVVDLDLTPPESSQASRDGGPGEPLTILKVSWLRPLA